MAKVEVIADSLHGPYSVFVNGCFISDVESYEFYFDEKDQAHRVELKLVVGEFHLLRKVTEKNVES